MKNKKGIIGIVVAFLVVIFLAQGFFYYYMLSVYNSNSHRIAVLRGRTEQVVAFINQALAEQQ
ncbi:MAG TPA: hypothetical protein ENN31_02255 [Candidatus Vogelbacteria bacterium]|nr:hypothetical protein [Candidatus Vogelbacteria bacterium]